MFAFGMLAVVLALFLRDLGLDSQRIGWLFSATLVGDMFISLLLTARADRWGRRKTLVLGSALMAASSFVFAYTGSFWLLVLCATIGVLSPSGNEIGPFLAVEQAAISHELVEQHRVRLFAWYNLAGYVATAFGSAVGGLSTHALQGAGRPELDSYRVVLVAHGCVALLMMLLYAFVSRQSEVQEASTVKSLFGLHKSRETVFKLSSLFAIDAFAGGFVMQSLIAYWFFLRWHAGVDQLGLILTFGNLFAGASALVAAKIARRFGLVNTMVWTHIPSNVLLILVPLMPTFGLAIAVLLTRFCLSQMDVPTRQALVMKVVEPDERSAAGGVANVARSAGVSVSPLFLGMLFARPALGLTLICAGVLKIVYDLSLWLWCRKRGIA